MRPFYRPRTKSETYGFLSKIIPIEALKRMRKAHLIKLYYKKMYDVMGF